MDRPIPRSPLYVFCAQSHKHKAKSVPPAVLSSTSQRAAWLGKHQAEPQDPNPLFTYFQTVTAISLSVYYVKNIFMDLLSLKDRSVLVLLLSQRTWRRAAQARCEVKSDWQCAPVPSVLQEAGTQSQGHQPLPVTRCSSETGTDLTRGSQDKAPGLKSCPMSHPAALELVPARSHWPSCCQLPLHARTGRCSPGCRGWRKGS